MTNLSWIGILPAVLGKGKDGNLVELVPAMPCPDLLTEEEALRYLRLDIIEVEHPHETLRRYRKQGLIRGTQVGKCVRYLKTELERFLSRITENNPR